MTRTSRRPVAFPFLALPCALAGCGFRLDQGALGPSKGGSARVDASPSAGGVRFRPVDPRRVEVGGEMGRRIDLAVRGNILKIDNEAVFLRSFRAKDRRPGSYVGLGKHLDALVRLAYRSREAELVRLKDRLFAELVATQLPSGYIGVFRAHHMEIDWDLHEASYVLFALVGDHERFGGARSLEAAKRLAEYMMKVRPRRPVLVYVTTTGFERAFIALHRATGDGRYLEHVTVDGSLRSWRTVSGHAYHHLSLCLAQLDLYRLAPDPA
ncbi:MAG: beta-L-arabinofuranosidase domain-containing protein, partial [Planctomycetota bacterium]